MFNIQLRRQNMPTALEAGLETVTPGSVTETSRMGTLDFSLRFSGDRRYRHGDRFTGQVTATAREPWTVVFAEAILFLRSEGMGNRNEARAATIALAQPGRDIMRTLDAPFEFTAPLAPSTYYGTLIKLHWMVGIYIQGKGSKVRGLIEIPIIIHPQPESIELPELIPGNEGKLVRVSPF
jgi:hypothetical protein